MAGVELGRWAVIVEEHYGRPMDIEWAKDGETVIEDTACVETSYPGFAAQLRQLFDENG